ncbi:glycosyltransferase family 4 protein [Paenibacillus apiarius]|uniref:Glycosyltransferase family 4 protein n=1 Tax=Paenibacillus apiarius TaxID=46240 RepID=A0ABT4DYA8_9BACL|nr:glycosyltransferase family 4 protein [Paenibacillus apiarius]MBN3525566.1 glycosyltransferase family 4 protein [Paenibacillus apiarius]MCY9512585.1 glycosyltransferase family 4 protein [Paenibacillus apiarius]MCY9522342.1 glycosyltransferase family 4 protein [Paenibacillus apiarius]MCY9553694.1 glycosyltransferase family 4 protein [Paenibacillus apiarius]MCY9556637.1 glycosyltransferase family 4 protein [Paenibacillus apiarius]
MRLPKVAVITPGTFPIPSGSSSSVERVVEYVASLASDRMEARIYSKQWFGQERYGTVRGVPCERVSAGSSRMYLQGVMQQLRAFAPDIIQVENRPRFVLPLIRSFPDSRVWLSLHSTTFINPKHIARRMLRLALRSADRIFVNSRYLFNQVATACPECASRIIINPLGVDGERFISRWTGDGERRVQAGKQMQGWEHRDIIMYVGRIIPLKGVHCLLRAVPQVIEKHPQALFVIVGSAFYGSLRKTAYVRRLERIGRKYPHHVRFVPYVPHEEVPKWYALADMAVVPSVAREAFGLVNLEAMASGVPVVATRVGGIQEVVKDGVTGLLVPPFRLKEHLTGALLRMLGDSDMRRRMGEAAVRHVQTQFTWKQTAERWADEVCGCHIE